MLSGLAIAERIDENITISKLYHYSSSNIVTCGKLTSQNYAIGLGNVCTLQVRNIRSDLINLFDNVTSSYSIMHQIHRIN